MKVVVKLGRIKLEFGAKNNRKGIVEWNQGEEVHMVDLPADPAQIPDIFVYLVSIISVLCLWLERDIRLSSPCPKKCPFTLTNTTSQPQNERPTIFYLIFGITNSDRPNHFRTLTAPCKSPISHAKCRRVGRPRVLCVHGRFSVGILLFSCPLCGSIHKRRLPTLRPNDLPPS